MNISSIQFISSIVFNNMHLYIKNLKIYYKFKLRGHLEKKRNFAVETKVEKEWLVPLQDVQGHVELWFVGDWRSD